MNTFNTTELECAYIYQGNNLIVPESTSDNQLHKEVSLDLIQEAFDAKSIADRFVTHALNDQADIAAIVLTPGALPPGWKAIPVRQAVYSITAGKLAEDSDPVGRVFRSYHIATWRAESRFCGSCGSPNQDAEEEETARQCPSCGRLEYPRISPAVIVIVTNDKGEALLAHNVKFVDGLYSPIAGFNEAGESIEATVRREIKEEVNIDVTDIRYVRSQPWPFPNSIMLAFTARYLGGELKADHVEIEDAQWFSRDKLPLIPGYGFVSRYLIGLWLDKVL